MPYINPTFDFSAHHRSSAYAHKDAGRNDNADDGWQEDETADDREADYRRAIPFDDSEMAILAERLSDEPYAIESLLSIADYDAHLAGLHLASLMETLKEKRAEELANQDRGNAQELICNVSDPVTFEMRIENVKAALRKG